MQSKREGRAVVCYLCGTLGRVRKLDSIPCDGAVVNVVTPIIILPLWFQCIEMQFDIITGCKCTCIAIKILKYIICFFAPTEIVNASVGACPRCIIYDPFCQNVCYLQPRICTYGGYIMSFYY